MKYNWELPDWPNFTYNILEIEHLLYAFTIEAGEVSGLFRALPNNVQQDALLQLMLSEAIKTSEIEGEYLSRQDVMSSLQKALFLDRYKSLFKCTSIESHKKNV